MGCKSFKHLRIPGKLCILQQLDIPWMTKVDPGSNSVWWVSFDQKRFVFWACLEVLKNKCYPSFGQNSPTRLSQPLLNLRHSCAPKDLPDTEYGQDSWSIEGFTACQGLIFTKKPTGTEKGKNQSLIGCKSLNT